MPATRTDFLYDGSAMIAEYNSSGALARRYVHGVGTDAPSVWYEGSGTGDRRWLHADERGSIVALSNASGVTTTSNTIVYDPYGESSTISGSRFQYTGQMMLPEVGLYYYKARIYSADLGRFLQADPIGYAAGMNMYAYVDGDPINRTDPSGLCDVYEFEYTTVSSEIIGPNVTYTYGSGTSFISDCSDDGLFGEEEDEGEGGGGDGGDGGDEEDEEEADPSEDALCTPMTANFDSYVGTYAAVGVKLFSTVHVDFEVNFLKAVTPASGDPLHFTRGGAFSLGVGKFAIGFNYESVSYDMANWAPNSASNFNVFTFSYDTNGLSASITPPQAFAGFTTSLDNIENGIIECAH